MSVFCVFGVKHSDCIATAKKLIPCGIGRQLFSQKEIYEFVHLLADHLFEETFRSKQISPAFDTPQFAQDWIDLAKKTGQAKDCKIMSKGDKVDKKGDIVIRKGVPVKSWIEWTGRK